MTCQVSGRRSCRREGDIPGVDIWVAIGSPTKRCQSACSRCRSTIPTETRDKNVPDDPDSHKRLQPVREDENPDLQSPYLSGFLVGDFPLTHDGFYPPAFTGREIRIRAATLSKCGSILGVSSVEAQGLKEEDTRKPKGDGHTEQDIAHPRISEMWQGSVPVMKRLTILRHGSKPYRRYEDRQGRRAK